MVGGGNFFRGEAIASKGMDRVTADYTGMLATIMNGLALQDALKKVGVDSRVQTSIEMKSVAEPFILRRALRHLEKGRVVIFAGGTGNPYFTTDTTAALRATEIKADVVFKATNIDGVYDDDPSQNTSAKKYDKVSYMEVLSKRLKVMDSTALSLSMDNNMPMVVFDLKVKGNLVRALTADPSVGTFIGE